MARYLGTIGPIEVTGIMLKATGEDFHKILRERIDNDARQVQKAIDEFLHSIQTNQWNRLWVEKERCEAPLPPEQAAQDGLRQDGGASTPEGTYDGTTKTLYMRARKKDYPRDYRTLQRDIEELELNDIIEKSVSIDEKTGGRRGILRLKPTKNTTKEEP